MSKVFLSALSVILLFTFTCCAKKPDVNSTRESSTEPILTTEQTTTTSPSIPSTEGEQPTAVLPAGFENKPAKKLDLGKYDPSFNLDNVFLFGISGDFLYYYKETEASDAPEKLFYCYNLKTNSSVELGKLEPANIYFDSTVFIDDDLVLMRDDLISVKTYRMRPEKGGLSKISETPSNEKTSPLIFNVNEQQYIKYWYDPVSTDDYTVYLELYGSDNNRIKEILAKHYDGTIVSFIPYIAYDQIYLLELEKNCTEPYLCTYDMEGKLLSRESLNKLKQIVDKIEISGFNDLGKFWVFDDYFMFSSTTGYSNSILKRTSTGYDEWFLNDCSFLAPSTAGKPDDTRFVIYSRNKDVTDNILYNIYLFDGKSEKITGLVKNVSGMLHDGKTIIYCDENGYYYQMDLTAIE